MRYALFFSFCTWENWSYASFHDRNYIVKNISRLQTQVCLLSKPKLSASIKASHHCLFQLCTDLPKMFTVHSAALGVQWSVKVEAFLDVLGPCCAPEQLFLSMNFSCTQLWVLTVLREKDCLKSVLTMVKSLNTAFLLILGMGHLALLHMLKHFHQQKAHIVLNLQAWVCFHSKLPSTSTEPRLGFQFRTRSFAREICWHVVE